ncbi:MAG: M56 family metallopeptidase [Muribaculaceae bacterium]|nr:M56 family metallopeptidase [Muribaculaceae bacterium]
MSGERQHTLNRWTLLSIYAVSIILPIIILYLMFHNTKPEAGQGTIEIGEVTGGIPKIDAKTTLNMTSESILKILSGIYIIGAIVTAIYFLVGLVTLWRIIERGERKEYGTFQLILAEDTCRTAPFSWGRSIVMSRKDYEEFGDMILLHEYAHLRRHHWIDLVIAYSTICLQWYNPAAWGLREELKAVHEYQVDEMVMNTGVDGKEYQMMLLQKATGYGYQSFANSLNHSKLLKRIAMMYEKKTSLQRRLFVLTLVPAIGAGIGVTAIPSVAGILRTIAETSGSNPTKAIATVPDETPEERAVFIAVEDPAEFPEGMEALMKWLSNNVVYPQEAEKAGIQGRVIVRFVIEADGTVTHPEIIRGISPEIDAEVVRLINSMPKWTPGKVNGKEVASYFTLPVVFRL